MLDDTGDETVTPKDTSSVDISPIGKKKRKHRRGKKRKGRVSSYFNGSKTSLDGGTDDEYEETETETSTLSIGPTFPGVHALNLCTSTPMLRPVEVPNAPENSTQFLIDDHENSSLFLDFEQGYNYQNLSGMYSNSFVSREDTDGLSASAEDDSSWAKYSEQDFEKMYRSAKEEELLSWSRETLISEILKLEKKAYRLETQISLRDPKVYIAKLQEQLLHLQEENKQLRDAKKAATNFFSHIQTELSSDDECPVSSQDTVPDSLCELETVVAPLTIQENNVTGSEACSTPPTENNGESQSTVECDSAMS